MSFPHPFQELQPEVKLETFEDLTTVRRAVGEVRGFNDPMTSDLRDDTQHSLNREGFQFQPKSYVGDEAKTIVRALQTIASHRDDELALSASDALRRMPKRLRAAAFISGLVKPGALKPSASHEGPRFPLYDEAEVKTYPETVWKSKYDQSDSETKPH